MTDTIVEQFASKLATLTYLDLSYCGKIGARALESIGKNCKSLTVLCRNTHPLETGGKHPQNDEAQAIAATMPNLTRLEIAYFSVDTDAVLEIIRSCVNLAYLDLRGCWDVKIDEGYMGEKYPKLKVVGPQVVDQYARNDWDDECSDYDDDDDDVDDGSFYEDYESLDDDDDDERIGGLHLRFYEGFDEDSSGYGWPVD
jgi:hypothetical protein